MSKPTIQALFVLAFVIGMHNSSTASKIRVMSNSTSEALLIAESIADPCQRPWFFRNRTTYKCECGPDIPGVLTCSENTREVWLNILYCMTFENTTRTTLLAECPFSGLSKNNAPRKSEFYGIYVLLPENLTDLNGGMCAGMNRKGPLCSKCKPGHGPALLSYDRVCTKCSQMAYAWLMYLIFSCVPTTIFFVIVIACQVSTTSAPLNFFIFASQLLSFQLSQSPQVTSGYIESTGLAAGLVISFFGVWNLDFFRFFLPNLCISENFSEIQVLCMDYIVAFYPLILVVVLYVCIQQHAKGFRPLVCLWKPFSCCLAPLTRRMNWNPAESLVRAFASILLLSSAKILSVSMNLLKVTPFYIANQELQLQSTYSRLFYKPSISIFSKEHLPYAILAVCVPLIFVLLPCLILILYPTRAFQQCLNRCRIRWHAVHAFADAFNGCYKDGTNGSRDYRSFAGFYLFFHILFLTLYNIPDAQTHQWVHTVVIIAALVAMAVACPYKNKLFNIIDISLLTASAILFCSPPKYFTPMTIAGVVIGVTYFAGYVGCRILFKLSCKCSFKKYAGAVFRSSGGDASTNGIPTSDECNLPDRLLNPERYSNMDLPDVANEEAEPLLSSSTESFPSYGMEK